MNLDIIVSLQTDFGKIYDENFKLKDKTRLADFNKELEEVGISSKLTPKEIELKLQQLYEALIKVPTKTTLNKDESAQLIAEAEKRDADIAKTRENQTKLVEDFKKRGEALYTEQQKIKELKDLHIKVEKIEKVQFTPEEKTVFEEYKKEAILHPEETAVKLAQEIHIRIDPILKEQGIPQEEIEILVNKTAQRTVENLVESTLPEYITPTAHILINNAVFENIPKIITQNTQEVIKASIATSSVYRFQPDLFYKDILKTALGENVASAVFGSNYKITVSEIPAEGYFYTYNFARANDEGKQIYQEQNQTLQKLQSFGGNFAKDEARNYLVNQSATYFAKTSLGQKVLSNPKAQIAFYSVFKGAGKTVTWTGGNFVGNAVLKFAPEYAPLLNLVTGTKFVTPVITQATAKVTGQVVGEVATQVAVKTGVTATLSATLGTALSWIPGIGTAIGIAVGWFVGKLIEKINWPKVKKWFQENGPVLAGVAGLGALALGGPAVGGLVLLGGLAATGTLGAFATGAFGVLGFIGRSVGIAIATPVIVTLLVLPPLVAFIMLVINNSAYVVPPSPLSRTSSNPYIEVTKSANPAGPFENSDLPLEITYTVTIRAKRENLTNIKISDNCRIVQEASTIPCDGPEIETPQSISPSSPFTFTYTNTYNAFTVDALVVNTIEVTASVQNSEEQSSLGTASITIGEPPAGCLEPSGDWPPDKKALVVEAIETIRSKYPSYLAKICESYPNEVPLLYNRAGSGNLWGYWSGGKVTFYPKGLVNDRTAIYVVSHELLHVLMSGKYYSIFKEYENVAGIFSETPRCFYSYNASLKEERLGEAVAFSIMPTQSCSLGGNSSMSRWPKHRDFVLQKILR